MPPRAQPKQAGQQPLPTDHAHLKLAVIQKRMEWNRARRAGGGPVAGLMAMSQWLLARLNALRP
ncbi:MAG: ribonuclease BN, partial [Arthrobacter sp.]|nr:ribonuclease BN [Arthrobacter sp.]